MFSITFSITKILQDARCHDLATTYHGFSLECYKNHIKGGHFHIKDFKQKKLGKI